MSLDKTFVSHDGRMLKTANGKFVTVVMPQYVTSSASPSKPEMYTDGSIWVNTNLKKAWVRGYSDGKPSWND